MAEPSLDGVLLNHSLCSKGVGSPAGLSGAPGWQVLPIHWAERDRGTGGTCGCVPRLSRTGLQGAFDGQIYYNHLTMHISSSPFLLQKLLLTERETQPVPASQSPSAHCLSSSPDG